MKRMLFIGLGSVSLALGVIGVFLPILPTTPFVLLSGYFYLRSSQRLYDWLLRHKRFGPILHNYIEHRAIPKRAKCSAIVLIWITIPISMILIGKLPYTIGLAIIGLLMSLYIVTRKTLVLENN